MNNLSERIIEKISQEKITPAPGWKYVVQRTIYWALTILAVVLGGLSLGLAIYLLQSLDWGVYTILGYGSLHSFIMSAFPYVFVLAVLVFLVGAYAAYRQTSHGYRVNFLTLALSLIIFASSFGFLVHIFGANQKIYMALERSPQIRTLMYGRENQWLDPQRGLLWGEVEKNNDSYFSLKDMNQKEWQVTYDQNTQNELASRNLVGLNVAIIGQMTGDNQFYAKSITPWSGAMNCDGGQNMMGVGERGNNFEAPGGMMVNFGGECGTNSGGNSCGE